MKFDNSLSEFFFIVIPGIYLIALIEYFFGLSSLLKLKITDDGLIVVSYLFIAGFLIGFILHGITKFAKRKIVEKCLFFDISNGDYSDYFNLATDELSKSGINIKDDENGRRKFFYTLNNYVWAKGYSFPSFPFAQRLVFWGNIFFASLAILSILVLFSQNILTIRIPIAEVAKPLLVIFLLISWSMFNEHIKNNYLCILSTFVAVRKLDKSDHIK